MEVGSKLITLCLAPHGGHDPVADHQGPNIAPLALGHKPLDKYILFGALQRFDDRFGHLGIGSKNHPYSLRSFEELDDDRCAANPFNGGQHIGTVTNKGGRRYANVVSGENLDSAQLVARVGDSIGRVGGVDVHLLELADDGQSVERDRRADPRQHSLIVGQRFATILEIGLVSGEVDRKSEGVECSGFVASFCSRRLEALRAVGVWGPGQNREFQGVSFRRGLSDCR